MQLLNCGNQWNRRFQYRAKTQCNCSFGAYFEREADSPKLLKAITTQRMEFLEGVDVLAKQDTVWNSWERWNHRAFAARVKAPASQAGALKQRKSVEKWSEPLFRDVQGLTRTYSGRILPTMMSMDRKPKHLDPAYQTALIICAMLNLAMLFIEGSAGLWIGSAALLADAGDFLEDAIVLGLAFVAIGWSVRARGAAGLVQGFAMAGVGIAAIVQIVHRILKGGAPSPALIGGVAALALTVNAYCAYRLIRFRGGDASMRAIWLSTRNDAMLNVLTFVAAAFIAITGSGWPDIIAGAIIATVNLMGSIEVISSATGEMRKTDSD